MGGGKGRRRRLPPQFFAIASPLLSLSLFSAAFRAYQNGYPDWPERGGKKEGGGGESFPFPHRKKSLRRISSCVGFPFPRPKKGIFLYFPFFSPVTLDISSFLLLPHPRFNNRKEELDWKPRPARREPSRPKRVFPRVTIDDRRHGWKRKEMTERKEEERGDGDRMYPWRTTLLDPLYRVQRYIRNKKRRICGSAFLRLLRFRTACACVCNPRSRILLSLEAPISRIGGRLFGGIRDSRA